MKLHNLKIQKQYMNDIYYGSKKFELRKNDRDYQKGDIIEFTIVDKKGNENQFEKKHYYYINYVLKNVEKYGLKRHHCILGIAPITFIIHNNESESLIDNKQELSIPNYQNITGDLCFTKQ